MRCVLCHIGMLQPVHLIITLTYDGHAFPLDVPDGRVCDHCGEEYMGENGAAFLLTHRALASHAQMNVTVSQRPEIV
jgi:YgiT-type zinc finger domain-containing protein